MTFLNCYQNSDEEDDEQKDGEQTTEEERARAEVSVSVKDLINPPKQDLHMLKQTRLEGITGTPDERCKDGLQCLRKVRFDHILCCITRGQTGPVHIFIASPYMPWSIKKIFCISFVTESELPI